MYPPFNENLAGHIPMVWIMFCLQMLLLFYLIEDVVNDRYHKESFIIKLLHNNLIDRWGTFVLKNKTYVSKEIEK